MGLLQRIDTQLQLFHEVSALAEIGFDGAAAFALEHDMRRAITRCVFCRQSETCRQWLNERADGLYPEFCPNAAYFARYGRPHERMAA